MREHKGAIAKQSGAYVEEMPKPGRRGTTPDLIRGSEPVRRGHAINRVTPTPFVRRQDGRGSDRIIKVLLCQKAQQPSRKVINISQLAFPQDQRLPPSVRQLLDARGVALDVPL